MARKKEEGQGKPVPATQWGKSQFLVIYQGKKRQRTQINKIINERGDIITDTKEIQRFIRYYYKQLHPKQTEQPGRNG